MNLLADSAGIGWIADIVFFAIVLIGMIIGIKRGFVRGICKLGGTLLAVVIAFSFCTPLQAWLESAFGFTTLIQNGIGNATLAGWLSIATCFVGLLILTKLAAWLIGKLAQAIVGSSGGLAAVDRILGAVLGLAEAFLFCFIVLTVFHWLNIAAVNDFIASGFVVKAIYTSPWFIDATHLPIIS